MPENNKDKASVSNDNVRDKQGDKQQDSRGEAVRSAGNKVHGDKLEGLIGSSSEAERMNNRPTRDDGDNDDEGELDDSEPIGQRH